MSMIYRALRTLSVKRIQTIMFISLSLPSYFFHLLQGLQSPVEESEFEIFPFFCLKCLAKWHIFKCNFRNNFLRLHRFWLGGSVLIFGRKNGFSVTGLDCCNFALYVQYFVDSYKKLLGFFPLYPNSYLNSLLIIRYHTMCWRRTCSSKNFFSCFYWLYCSAFHGSVCLHFSQEGSKPLFSVLLSSCFSTVLQKH